jgi:3-dehydroquinate synthase
MKSITVTHPTGSYPIYLGEDALAAAGQHLAELDYSGRCVVATNETVGQHHAEPLLESLQAAGFVPIRIDIPDGEQFKTLGTVATLYHKLIEAKLDRRSPVIALGGGVLGDTVGFAAASFLRGVPFVQIPTTLLAMVDASVGGKTGVDLPQGKNLVGAFKQPEMVVVDPNVLTTLPEAEFRAGLAEVVKSGIIGAPELFAALEDGSRGTARPGGRRENSSQPTVPLSSLLPNTYPLSHMLYEAISVKVQVVQEDPFEQGRRVVLNLGHTFAHAFERLANFEMRHGEAVAIGLACAARLATRLEYCAGSTSERIIALLAQLNLPTQVPTHPPADIWSAMATDKKRQGHTLRFILPRAIGDVDIFGDVQQEDVEAVLEQGELYAP